MPTTADIQAAEIHSYFQGNALFQPVRDSSHETPRCLAQKWEDGCRAGDDRAIIRLPRPDSAVRNNCGNPLRQNGGASYPECATRGSKIPHP
jgi:hypothetical protein